MTFVHLVYSLFFLFFSFFGVVYKERCWKQCNADANALSLLASRVVPWHWERYLKTQPARPLRSNSLSILHCYMESEVGVASPTLDFKRHPFSFYYLSFLSAHTNYSTSTKTNPSSLSLSLSLSRSNRPELFATAKKNEWKNSCDSKCHHLEIALWDYLFVPPFWTCFPTKTWSVIFWNIFFYFNLFY